MYTIRHAATLTGVTESTLRAWERRYGVLTPQRSPAGYRLYDERDLDTIRTMQALTESGWAPRQAAQEMLRRSRGPAGGRSQAPDDDERFGPLRQAAVDLDEARVSALLDEQFRRGTFENVVDDWLMPALQAIGEDWACGRISVVGEHVVANAVQRRLLAAYEAAARETLGPAVLAGLPPGAAHELGVLAFAVAARRAGLRATYLGSLPASEWAIAVQREGAACVVLTASMESDLAALGTVVDALQESAPSVRIGVGGCLQDRAPQPAEPLGPRIGLAADRLARTLAAQAFRAAGKPAWATTRPSRGRPR